MINKGKISFVIQGPISSASNHAEGIYTTAEVLQSIRQHYPGEEIVLSTWKGSDLSGLVYDELVLSDDPGGFVHYGVTINNNRLILSAKVGIQKATNQFVVKSRTDILFTDNSLYDRINDIKPVSSTHGLFNKSVISTIYYVRDPLKLNLVFHPSDIFLFGEKEDMSSYFDVPLEPRHFFVNKDETTRIVPEQYFLVHSIFKKKGIDFNIPYWGYTKLKYFTESEKYLFNNFTFFDTKELGIEFPKRLYSVFMADANYTLSKAQALSKAYKDKSIYGAIVPGIRAIKYLMRYHLRYYLKVLWHKTFGRFLKLSF